MGGVNRDVPVGNLRWSIAHLNDASADSLRRMKALGIGWTAQPGQRVPPVETAKELGVVVDAGTDASSRGILQSIHRAAAIYQRSGRNTQPYGGAPALHAGQRVVLAR
jgi:predicted amidohydrolase YtcJ